MKTIITSFIFSFWCLISTAQTTAIPDPYFEQELIDLEIDSDGIVNGQILNADALNVTNLTIMSSDSQHLISDLTGLEAFINIDTLKVNYTMIEELNVNGLISLKYLDCTDNMLTSIDLSNNILLEYINISSGGDVLPFNDVSDVDLSSNPNIKKITGYGLSYINLKNGNNNPEMTIDIGPFIWANYPDDYILGNTCIEVDNQDLAQNNQFPYSEWDINHMYWSHSFVEDCSLKTSKFQNNNTVTLYPNPATNVVNITNREPVTEATIYNMLGQKVKQLQAGSTTVTGDVSSLTTGTYFIMVKTGTGNSTLKVIIN